METPKNAMSIAEAAEAWIAMIEAPEMKATQEQKDALIAKIRASSPKVKARSIRADGLFTFVDATNQIKHAMRS